jgi:hypothetical protein
MRLTEATTLYRKSGEAEGSAVPWTFRGNVFRQSGATCSSAIRLYSPLCHPACPGLPWDRSAGICSFTSAPLRTWSHVQVI